jgi:putative membrane protein
MMMVGFGFFGLLLMVLFWGGLIFGAVWLVRALFQGGMSQTSGMRPERPIGARETLDQRYARGEISRDEYETMRRDLDSS